MRVLFLANILTQIKSGIAFMQIEHNKVIDSKPTVVSLNKLLTTIKTYGK